jgi:RNA polymerase sigma-70 factor, ECF subfamily
MKFLNKTGAAAVFMIESRRVVAGDAILSGLATGEQSRAPNKDDSCDTRTGQLIEQLVREHSRLVYRIAYAVLRRHHDAEDATQETFLRVLRYSAKLDAVENPKTWLARIAWRVAVERSGKRDKTREIALEDPERLFAEIAFAEPGAEEKVQGTHVEAALEKLIAALPAKLREPLILSAIDEMSPREVAATLGINEAAVRSRIFRARQILKEKLAERVKRK